jgi:hypothetical protein
VKVVTNNLTCSVSHIGKALRDVYCANILSGDRLCLEGLFGLHIVHQTAQVVVLVAIFQNLTPRVLEHHTTEEVWLGNQHTVRGGLENETEEGAFCVYETVWK